MFIDPKHAMGLIDNKITDYYESIYKPEPIMEDPKFIPSRDVSLILCMLDPLSIFINCLRN
jgi:hypothetical protein